MPELEREYGVVSLALFGSYVRGEEREDSDLDVLVGFNLIPSLLALRACRGTSATILVHQSISCQNHVCEKGHQRADSPERRLKFEALIRGVCPRHTHEAMVNTCAFVEGMEYSAYVKDVKTNMAVERAITIIGEAARNVPEEIRKRFPTIPWADMVGMRNFVTHAYFRVDRETVWKTITVVIPDLLPS